MGEVPGPLEILFFRKVSMKHAVRSFQKIDLKANKLKIGR